MRAVVKAGHMALATYTESVLSRLGYKFIVNGGGEVIEFELEVPCRCIVSVRDASGVKMRVPFVPTTRRESVIDIRRMIGGEQDPVTLLETASAIAGALSQEYPKLNWKQQDWVD